MPEGSGKGGGLSPATIFFFILAFFGVGTPLMMSTARPSPSSANSSDKLTKATGRENSAEDLLEEFYDANPDEFIDADRPWQHNEPIYPGPNERWSDNDPRRNDRISFLIATLPNPDDPSLRYEFDRYIDSIQRALSHESYLLDKTYLPWVEELGADSDGGANGTSDKLKRSRRPGVMLFRRADTADENHAARDSLIVVFVVGETPTDGVDAAALRSALDQIAWLRGWTANGDSSLMKLIAYGAPLDAVALATLCGSSNRLEWLVEWMDGETPAPLHLVELTHDNPDEIAWIAPTVTIIGPSYSGSAKSIQEVLHSWLFDGSFPQPAPRISLLSGTATAISKWPPALGEFHSTQLPEDETARSVAQFFRRDLNDPSIAILADSTSYGNSIAKYFKKGHAVTILPYPIHISGVRTAADSFHAQQPNPAATPMSFAHRDPSIPSEDPGRNSYIVPSFSRTTAAGDEMILADLLATVNREKFHYVGIVATDIQDAIFLVREIRDNCPDTIPFLTSADLLYLHSDFNHDLAGTLIFSTYPLFASNQIWTWPSTSDYKRRYQFASGEAEGVYNAVLAALSDSDLMVEYTLPFSSTTQGPLTSESKDPPYSASEVPPLWVSVVGNDALWPVALYPSPPNRLVLPRPLQFGSAEFLPSDFGASLYPREFTILFVSIILLCALPQPFLMKQYKITGFGMSGFYRLIGRITPRPPLWLALLLDDTTALNPADRRLSLLSFVLVLLTFFIVASAVWLLPLHAMNLWTPPPASSALWLHRLFDGLLSKCRLLAWKLVPTLIAGIAGVLMLLSLCGIALDTVKQARRPDDRASWTATITLIASGVGVLLAFWFVGSIWSQKPLRALIYFVRATNLWNGVSPLLPLLYVGSAALWLSVSELRRLSLSEEYVLNNNFLGFGDENSFSGIGAHERAIVNLLKCSTDKIPFLLLWVPLPCVVYLLLDFPGIRLIALDGQVFTIFFILIAFFVYTSLLLLFGRFIAVWFKLRSLLSRLAMHPTRRAYEELRTGSVAASMAARQRIPLVAPKESVIAVEFCLERVREMLRLVEPSSGKNSPALTIAAETIAGRVSAARVALADLLTAIQLPLDTFLRHEAGGEWQPAIKWKSWLQSAMSDLSRQVTEIFEPLWHLDRGAHLAADPATDKSSLDEPLIRNGELFVAARVVDFLQQVFPQLMNLVIFASVGLLVLMLAVSSYPFPQRDTIGWLSWIILLSVIGVTFIIFIQINRDRIVSMLSGTTPGELNWDSGFVWQLVIFGLIPILTLAGAQFPHALQGAFSSVGGLFGGAH